MGQKPLDPGCLSFGGGNKEDFLPLPFLKAVYKWGKRGLFSLVGGDFLVQIRVEVRFYGEDRVGGTPLGWKDIERLAVNLCKKCEAFPPFSLA